ncbi:MAG: hypothetical protein HON94_15915 [Methylococcales bacterium]|jgi:3-hydroxymyristoyl/3-hydroxydecanoyl-(acyl carrier protein) dehydratase|nr:hypothetical protein [Methylococcales bacterium]MBT7408415.1 hypothetical protein [Methylococcales bacterium]
MSDYKIITSETVKKTQAKDGYWSLYIQVPEDLIYFQGHFDGFPVTPGIIQLKWVIEFIEKKTKQSVQVKKIQAMKFNNPLLPNDYCTMQIGWENDHYFYKLYNREKKISSGKIIPSVKPNINHYFSAK